MYGVTSVSHQSTRPRSHRNKERLPTLDTAHIQKSDKTNTSNTSITTRVLQYIKQRFNPEPEDELDELVSATSRHRPEDLTKLAQLTNFSRKEIKLIYRGFKQECPSGIVDEDGFKHIFAQFFPQGDATGYAHFVFNTIKHKQSGKVNFEEFLSILSRASRGTMQEKLSWVFSLYDVDGDGRISRADMLGVVRAVYELLGRGAAPQVQDAGRAAKDHVDRIFDLIDTDQDGMVSEEELARWCAREGGALLGSFDTLDTVL